MASKRNAARLVNALPFLVYAQETGLKVSAERLETASLVLTEAAVVASSEPEGEHRRTLHS